MSLTRKRCFNHADREAVAKCLQCGYFFCRECITEHGHRLICSNCLATSTKSSRSDEGVLLALRIGMVIMGCTVAWLFFYVTAQILLSIKDAAFEEEMGRRPVVRMESKA